MSPSRLARLRAGWPVLTVAAWVLLAVAGNVAVPQLERVVTARARAFIPADVPSSIATRESARVFGETPGNNFNYVVLERNAPLSEPDMAFYRALLAKLRADASHVIAVTDLLGDPVTAPAARSADGSAATLMVRLAGPLGTAQAADAVTALRATVAGTRAPPGLDVYVTGPGATITDEFAAIDRQMLAITGATVALILLLLLLVYRSPVTAAIPLLAVGLAMAVARPIVALLGDVEAVEVSLFSVALLAAMMLGAGTDYGIFLIGRYQEGRRRGAEPARAIAEGYRAVAPVIVGSALTIAAALGALAFARVGMLRSAGIPCAIGILIAMSAALTLTPALLTLAVRRGYVEPVPRRAARSARRWRRIGAVVARWPGPVLVPAVGLIFLLALPLSSMHVGWDEPAATPAGAESNRGYAAANRHFAANQLFPVVVTLVADHDLRNPAGLIAIERISKQLMGIPGVRMVQSASRPAGKVPDEATLSHQAGLIGSQFREAMDGLTERLNRVADLDATLANMQTVLGRLRSGLSGGAAGLSDVGSAAADMRSGIDGLNGSVVTVAGYLNPLRDFVAGNPTCPADPVCSAVGRVLDPVDQLVRSSAELSSGAAKLSGGSGAAAAALDGMPAAMGGMTAALRDARSATAEVAAAAQTMSPQLHQLTDYLSELDAQFAGSDAGGFYLPQRALGDPRFVTALRALMSADGTAGYLLVYGDGQERSGTGAARADSIERAVHEATKEGTLQPVAVYLNGVGPVTRDLRALVFDDMRLLVGVTLILVFGIVTLMLRSPVAGLAVVGTVVVSYASALGSSVLLWQHLLGQPLHWSVPAISLIALVAVGADYNLLLAMRVREEARAGTRTGMIRAFAGTGGVVTTAGVVFGLTMAVLAGSTVLSVAQIGTTIAVGLMVDTMVIRTLVVPSVAVLLGRWFWWPAGPLRGGSQATRRARSDRSR